jgi:cytochrome c oxidase subunit 3
MTATVSRRNTPDKALFMGMWLVIAASCMMFTGLTSAYVASQGLGPAWEQLSIRPLVFINTAILLLSSATMEHARRRAGRNPCVPSGLLVTLALGILFLAGQIALFRQMGQAGYYLNTGRQSSFFYVLTSLHGLHVMAGIVALAWLAHRLRGSNPRRAVRTNIVTLFWHFMGCLWIWLLLVLYA